MHNNKGLRKTRHKSYPELRKIYFQNGGNIGIENGHKIGMHEPEKHSLAANSER
ncbi:hypothetical protein M2651_09125 [Clostridium sp. SYSU_GA19001]|uniref:hypothetical protein n=1 Tax=Clostridium caldaquaticum TaxID=2940653 RepID=UPI0020779468|nr:hypothetical protein [Clostridium caldaquaticum]MCM8711189.1 hypothetical protein [Clostridium caldaquaticum]